VLAAVFAVFAMHGVNCVAGGDHSAGTASAHSARSLGQITHVTPTSVANLARSGAEALSAAVSPVTVWHAGSGGTHRHAAHGAACTAILTGLFILGLQAALASARSPARGSARETWLATRPRPPSASLRPSLSALCVLRT
jgi:hypothetical protein